MIFRAASTAAMVLNVDLEQAQPARDKRTRQRYRVFDPLDGNDRHELAELEQLFQPSSHIRAVGSNGGTIAIELMRVFSCNDISR